LQVDDSNNAQGQQYWSAELVLHVVDFIEKRIYGPIKGGSIFVEVIHA
jgi:hypothetical protein